MTIPLASRRLFGNTLLSIKTCCCCFFSRSLTKLDKIQKTVECRTEENKKVEHEDKIAINIYLSESQTTQNVPCRSLMISVLVAGGEYFKAHFEREALYILLVVTTGSSLLEIACRQKRVSDYY